MVSLSRARVELMLRLALNDSFASTAESLRIVTLTGMVSMVGVNVIVSETAS